MDSFLPETPLPLPRICIPSAIPPNYPSHVEAAMQVRRRRANPLTTIDDFFRKALIAQLLPRQPQQPLIPQQLQQHQHQHESPMPQQLLPQQYQQLHQPQYHPQQYYQQSQGSQQCTPSTPKSPLLARSQHISPASTPVIAPSTLAVAARMPRGATQRTWHESQPPAADGHPSNESTGPGEPSILTSPSSSKRKEMSSTPSDAPRAKEVKPGQTVANISGSFRSHSTQRRSRAGHSFSTREAAWLATQLQDPKIYLPLQSERDSTVRQTPKTKIYEKIAKDFNNHFTDIDTNVDARQIKNKIAKMKTQFKLADAKRNESGFDSTDEDQWKIIEDICPFYFDLEDAWSTGWGNIPPEYADSLSNLDDPFVSEDEDRDQMQDDEANEWVAVDEGVEEEEHVEEEEEETLVRRPRPQSQRRRLQNRQRSMLAQPLRKQHRQQEQEEQEGQERQDEPPLTSKKSKKALQESVIDILQHLSDVARLSVELEQQTRLKELEARRAKDSFDNSLALKRLEMEKEESERIHQRRMAEIETERAVNERKLAEVRAQRDVDIRRVELRAQVEQVLLHHDLDRKRQEFDLKLAELDTLIARYQPPPPPPRSLSKKSPPSSPKKSPPNSPL